MMSTRRTYQLFDKTLEVLSESPWMSEHIDCFLRPLAVEIAGAPDYRLGIFQTETSGGTIVHLCCPELDLSFRKPVGKSAWAAFRQCYLCVALSQNQPQYVIHGAAVTNDEAKCALLVGGSGAGKTTVMLGLLGLGWHYVTDDYVCIPLKAGLLRPLAAGCTVAETTFAAYPELESLRSDTCRFFHKGKWEWTVQPAGLYPVTPLHGHLKPSHLFYLYRDGTGPSAIKPIAAEDALWWFQLARFRSPVDTPPAVNSSLSFHMETFELARAFVRDVHFFRVMNGSIHDTVRLIHESLLG